MMAPRLRHGRSLRVPALLALADELRTLVYCSVLEVSPKSGAERESAQKTGQELAWEICLFARGERLGPTPHVHTGSNELD